MGMNSRRRYSAYTIPETQSPPVNRICTVVRPLVIATVLSPREIFRPELGDVGYARFENGVTSAYGNLPRIHGVIRICVRRRASLGTR
jgi:hypothetical protein